MLAPMTPSPDWSLTVPVTVFVCARAVSELPRKSTNKHVNSLLFMLFDFRLTLLYMYYSVAFSNLPACSLISSTVLLSER